MRIYSQSIILTADELNCLDGAIEREIHNATHSFNGCNPERFKTLVKLLKRLDTKTMSQEAIKNVMAKM